MEKNVWQAYKARGVQVLGLNVWDRGDVAKVKGFAKKYKLTYPVLMDKDEKVFQSMTSARRGVPTNAVIDRKGRLQWIMAGFSEQMLLDEVKKALK